MLIMLMCSIIFRTLSFPSHFCWVSVHSQQHLYSVYTRASFTDFHNLTYNAKAKEDHKTHQQKIKPTTAPCPPKPFVSRWENVTSSKPAIVANLSRDYNRMNSTDRPHHNQKVARPIPASPLASQTQNWPP